MSADVSRGKTAITNYETIEVFKGPKILDISLVKCILETGRTHQIRVHMSHKGNPILGDKTYGKKIKKVRGVDQEFEGILKSLSRQALHDHTLGFIEMQATAKTPFFAFVTYTQTHEPVDPHPDFYGSTGNGSFADVLAQTDAYVGDLLAKLDELDLSNNTIFIFTSDNGREGVPRSFGFTGPWRSGMFSPYEGSLRVPFLVKWPGKIPEKRVSNEMVHQLDVFPTIAQFAGVAVPVDRTIDGVDQSQFFMGATDRSARESLVIYIGNTLFVAKWRNWKILLR